MKTPSGLRLSRPPAQPSDTATLWKDVLASFHDAVVVMDRATHVVLFNQAAEELTGKSEAHVLGQPHTVVFDQAPLIGEIITRVREQGHSESRSEEYLSRTAHRIPVRITCVPVWDTSDQVYGTALIIADLRHQKTLEDSVWRNESSVRLGTLVAGLAHEVKNPLTGITGAAQLLEDQLANRPELVEYTSVIAREANRLTVLVENLLTMGTPPAPRLTPLNIHRVIQHVISLMAGDLRRWGIDLRCEFDPSLPDLSGDEGQLGQVLLNIVKNATEAMTRDGTAHPPRNVVTVTTRMETDFHILRGRDASRQLLRIEVADLGIGIDSADAGRIFEPFFTTKPRGTGLGLAISHRIVADHGGILCTAPNRPCGTVVSIILPLARP